MSASPLVSIELTGHLTVASLDAALAPVLRNIRGAPPGETVDLVVDVLQMTGYESYARERFVAFNAETRSRIRHVLILTTNRLYIMVISAMALASGRRMKAFDSRKEALSWLEKAKR